MNATIASVWLLTIALDTVGQLAFKAVATDPRAGTGLARWRHLVRRRTLWLGVSCYMFEFLAWTAFLSLVPLGRGVLLGSINIVVVMLGGRLLFRERLNALHMVGITMVCIGVAVVGFGA